jgi:hypothetical protein
MSKKPRSKTALTAAIIVIILVGMSFYYVTALRTADNRPVEEEQAR